MMSRNKKDKTLSNPRWRSCQRRAYMVCLAWAWAPTVCALSVWSVLISRTSCVRRVRACASHCCDKTYLMRSFLARFSRRIKTYHSCATKTTQHPLDCGLGSVGQRCTVEGARTGCAVLLFTQGKCPSHLRRACRLMKIFLTRKICRHLECVVGWWMAAGM